MTEFVAAAVLIGVAFYVHRVSKPRAPRADITHHVDDDTPTIRNAPPPETTIQPQPGVFNVVLPGRVRV